MRRRPARRWSSRIRARARSRSSIGPHYDDVVDDVQALAAERLELARAAGVPDERLVVCPGPDLGKDPAQTIELLRRLDELHDARAADAARGVAQGLRRRAHRRAAARRLAGTLAAVAHGLDRGAHVLRVHDVAATRDFLTVRRGAAGRSTVPADLLLADELRREPTAQEESATSAKEAAA